MSFPTSYPYQKFKGRPVHEEKMAHQKCNLTKAFFTSIQIVSDYGAYWSSVRQMLLDLIPLTALILTHIFINLRIFRQLSVVKISGNPSPFKSQGRFPMIIRLFGITRTSSDLECIRLFGFNKVVMFRLKSLGNIEVRARHHWHSSTPIPIQNPDTGIIPVAIGDIEQIPARLR